VIVKTKPWEMRPDGAPRRPAVVQGAIIYELRVRSFMDSNATASGTFPASPPSSITSRTWG